MTGIVVGAEGGLLRLGGRGALGSTPVLGRHRAGSGPAELAPGPGSRASANGFGGVGEPIDLVFDDSAAVAAPDTTAGALNCAFFGFPTTGGGSGNIAAFGDTTTTVQTADMCRARTFPQPGVYPYHSTLTGAAGTIVVTDGSDDS